MNRNLLVALACATVAFAQAPSNDNCAGAIDIFDGVNPGAPLGASGSTFTAVGATASGGAICVGDAANDVWFRYTAAGGLVTISTCTPPGYAAGTFTDTTMEVTDLCGGLVVGCDDDACDAPGFNSSCTFNSIAGVAYMVRIGRFSSGTTVGTFYVTVSTLLQGGDTCATAATLPGGDFALLSSLTGQTPTNPAPPGSTCASITTTSPDEWFTFVAPTNGAWFIRRDLTNPTTNGSTANITLGANAVGIYNGTGGCGALGASLVCSTSATPPFANLVGGTTYYLRLARTTATTNGQYTFSGRLIPPPANDECGGALTLAIGANPGTTAASTVSADPAGDTCTGFSATTVDTWHTFTPGSNSTAIITRTGAATQMGLYSGSCGALSTVLCSTGTSLATPVTAGTTYFLRVGQTTPTSAGAYSIDFQLVSPPANDECAGASAANLGPNAGTTGGASVSADPVGTCTGFTGTTLDTWHTFTAPAAGTFQATRTGTGASVLGLYNDVCGSGVSLVCGTTSVTATVAAGQTVLIRVGQATFASQGAYTLTLALVVAVTNDECANAIDIFDGVNPGAPTGTNGFLFSNIASTASAGYGVYTIVFPSDIGSVVNGGTTRIYCPYVDTLPGPDVFFKYVATCAATVVETCTPPGFTALGTLSDSYMAVYDACGVDTPLTCSDDGNCTAAGNLLSQVQFSSVPGSTYYIRVKHYQTSTGTFYLTVHAGGVFEDLTKPGGGNSPNVPRMMGIPPVMGRTGTLYLARFDANSPVQIYMSYCNAAPTDLSVLSPGCFAYLDLTSPYLLATVTTNAAGNATYSQTIPNDPTLSCLCFGLQAIGYPMDGTPVLQVSNFVPLRPAI
jgi:hypothetical protein